MSKDTMRRAMAVAAAVVIGAAILYLSFLVKSWACEGAAHPVRCILLR